MMLRVKRQKRPGVALGDEVAGLGGLDLGDDSVADVTRANANAHHDVRALAGFGATSWAPAAAKPALKASKPPSDAQQAKTALEAEIKAGIPDPGKLAGLLATMDADDREAVRVAHWPAIKAKCNAAQVITLGEIFEFTTVSIVTEVLDKKPTPAILGRTLRRLTPEEIGELTSDADTLAKLKAQLPGPVTLHFTTLRYLTLVANNAEMIRWVVETVPADETWRMVAFTNDKDVLAKTLNDAGLWGFLKKVNKAALSPNDVDNLRGYSKLVDPNSQAHADLQTLIAAAPKLPVDPPPEDWAERQKLEKQVKEPAKLELEKLLAGNKPFTSVEALGAVARARDLAKGLAKDEHAKQRVTGALSPQDVLSFTHFAGFTEVDRIEWLLATPKVSAAELVPPLTGLRGDDLGSVFGSATRVSRLHKILGKDVSLRSIIDDSQSLLARALDNAELRRWLLGPASAQDILEFVMMGDSADDIAKACKVIARERGGYGWVYELENLKDDTIEMRRLALALPDRKAAAHLMKFAYHEWPLTQGTQIGPEASDPSLLDSSSDHLKRSVAKDDGAEVTRSTAELTDEERAEITKDRTLVGKAITSSSGATNLGHDAVRVARELQGTLRETLRAVMADPSQIDHHSFRTYARERPSSEHVDVAGDAALTPLAEKLLFVSPFNALPGLAVPASLASALGANSSLLLWIERRTHPIEAIAKLGHPVVATVAARAFEAHGVALIKSLPKGLSQDQKAALMRIGAAATGKLLHEAASERLDVDAADDRSDQASALNTKQHLRDVLDSMVGKPFDPSLLLAICNAHPASEAHEVLVDEKRPQRIAVLRNGTQASPLTVFPFLAAQPIPQLFTNPALLDWLFVTEEPIAVLRMMAKQANAIGQVAAAIENKMPGAIRWIENLPSGYGMSSKDEATLHTLYREVSSDEGATRLFAARFGHMPDGQFSRESMDKLWTTLARLPDRQVEGNLKFGGLKRGGEVDGTGGGYTPGTGIVSIASDAPSATDRYVNKAWQTKQQLAAALGVDEADIDRRVKAGLVEKQTISGIEQFRIKEQAGHGFTDTLLHETGHAVDAMLGNRTSLVFGDAGWKAFGGGEFDAWAQDMHAWSGANVSDDDKAEIKTLFEQRLKSSGAIHGPSNGFADMVSSDHALKKSRNKNAAIVKAVLSGKHAFSYESPIVDNGRVFLMNFYYGRFYSYDAKAYGALTMPYAGFAPEEFFAESYTEYYRDENNKGGNLPMWIKSWFDANVDRIGHGPAKKP